MNICFASGKGGTGKTLLATNLAVHLSRHFNRAAYLDADVEEPNGFLFLKPDLHTVDRVAVALPALRGDSCSGCGACQRFCAFNAVLAHGDGVLVFSELCHNCGGCLLVCPEQALIELPREVGTLSWGERDGLICGAGRLDVGEPRAEPVIERLLERAPEARITVVDAAPGTSCSAVAAAKTAELLVLVTEPTPFGLHDLRLAVEMGRRLELPLAAVINRADLGDDAVRGYLEREGVRILGEIPFRREIAEAYSRGALALEASPELRRVVETLAREVIRAI